MIANPVRGLPREVGVLVAVAFAVAVGFGVVAPAIPLFAEQFGVGKTAAGGVISIFAAMRLVSVLGGGRLVDRLGERRVLALGIAIVAVSSALAGLSQSYLQLLVLRGAGGVGSAMFSVSALSLLLGAVPTAQRGRASGLFAGGFLLGGITGPAFGGLLTGVSIRAPFFLYAGTLAVAGSVGLLALPRHATGSTSGPAAAPLSLRAALRLRAYRAALAANFADSWAALGVRSALIPLFVGEVLHRAPVWTGVGFVVVAAVNAAVLLPAGVLADRSGRRPVLIAGCALSAVAMALLAVLPDLAGYLVAMAVFGLGSGLLDVAPAAVVGDVVSAGTDYGSQGNSQRTGRGGLPLAGYQMASDGGSVLGPVVAGRLTDALSYSAGFGLTAGILGLAAIAAVGMPETRHDPTVRSGALS